MQTNEICKVDDLQNNEAKGFIATVQGKQRNIFVVRKNDRFFAYLNWCPHNQVLIDQIPNKFFNADRSLIQCSKHGALFEIDGGLCIEGPCEGDRLKVLVVTIKDGNVFVN